MDRRRDTTVLIVAVAAVSALLVGLGFMLGQGNSGSRTIEAAAAPAATPIPAVTGAVSEPLTGAARAAAQAAAPGCSAPPTATVGTAVAAGCTTGTGSTMGLSADALAAADAVAAGPPEGRCTATTPAQAVKHAAELQAEKVTAYTQRPDLKTPGQVIDYAYVSQSFDVTGTGNYVLKFGPLAPGLFAKIADPVNAANPPEGIAVIFPDDYPVQSNPGPGHATVTSENGQRYLLQPLQFTGVPRPCTGLLAWLT